MEQDYSNSLSSLLLHCTVEEDLLSYQQQQAERNTITDPLQRPEEEQECRSCLDNAKDRAEGVALG